MQKLCSFLSVGVILTLMACGSGSTTSETSDSTTVASDSVVTQSVNPDVVAPDTTAVKQ